MTIIGSSLDLLLARFVILRARVYPGDREKMARCCHGGRWTTIPVSRGHMHIALVNPHNICYANAVLHMLHQARAREGLITGLGNLNGSFTQATRSNQTVNIARDPAWSYVWPGWQRPTRQQSSFNTFASARHAQPCREDGRPEGTRRVHMRYLMNSSPALTSGCRDGPALQNPRGHPAVA